MVPNHLELEMMAKQIRATRVNEADAQRLLRTARGTNSNQQRSPALLRIVSSGSRVRWWFRSRALGLQAPAAPSTPVIAAELATTISLDTVSASRTMLPADSYEALMVIARGSRQRHERLVTQRS